MKINPKPQGSPTSSGDGFGRTASPDKLAAAKTIAAGEPVVRKPAQPPQVPERYERLSMKTNATPQPYEPPANESLVETAPTPDQVDSAVSEETKPLSPQFAAIARQRRALQVRERAVTEKERALAAQPNRSQDLIGRLKAEPLSVLQEAGITYDQLTEAILASGNNPEVQKLREEVKSLKEGVDKTLSERDQQAEQQAVATIGREIDSLVSTDDSFELIRATDSNRQVLDLIHRQWKATGEIIDTAEACNLVENELVADALKGASTKKVQAKMAPTTPPVQQQRQRTMNTLTTRDTTRPNIGRRERAMAAFYGK